MTIICNVKYDKKNKFYFIFMSKFNQNNFLRKGKKDENAKRIDNKLYLNGLIRFFFSLEKCYMYMSGIERYIIFTK